MDQQHDDLKRQIELIGRARRHVARSVDASGVALRRTLSADSRDRRLDILLLLSVVVLLAAVFQDHWPAGRATRTSVPVAPPSLREPATPSLPASIRPAGSLGGALKGEPLVVHVRVTRPCRVRVVVDGTALEWRRLRAGDEFLSRPDHQIVIQTDDGGALSATVNGNSISLGADAQAVAIRLTSERPIPESVLAP